MAKRKQTATQKLRKLVQQQVRRMENRGYRISSELKEKIKTGKYQTLQSIRKNKYSKLYQGASAEIDSKIVTGRKYRQYERKKSAEKGAETRRVNTERKRQHDWEETRAREDEADATIAQDINQGEIMYRNVVDLIDKYPRAGADILQKALSSEINKYGLDLVMAGMAEAPIDVVGEAQNIVFYASSASSIHRSITNLFDAITGTIRSLQESMALGTAMDTMTDMSAL